jgi:hypothetical protein
MLKLELDLKSSQVTESELVEKMNIAKEKPTHHESSLKQVTNRSSKLEDLLNTHHNQFTNDVEKIVYLEALVMITKKSHAKVSLEALELQEKFQLMDLQL